MNKVLCLFVLVGLLGSGLRAQAPFWQRESLASGVALGAFVLQPDGRIVGSTPSGVVRLNADGAVDPTFSSPLGPLESVFNLIPVSGGKLLLSGSFLAGNATLGVLRLNADGTRDPTFQPPSAPMNYDRLVVDGSGRFYTLTGTSQSPLLRTKADGGTDETFQAAATVFAGNSFAPLTDGSVLSGPSTPRGSTSSTAARGPRLTRFLADGAIDSSFLPDRAALPVSGVFAIVPLPDGRAFVLGGDGEPTSTTRLLRLLRVTPAGVVDFAYHIRSLHNGVPVSGLEFVIAGVLFDLLREARATAPVTLDCTLFPFLPEASPLRMSLHPDGQLVLRSGAVPFARYVRTNAPAPSFDPKPTIIVEAPSGPAVAQGMTQVISVQAGGLFPLTYQWQFNGVPVAGATTATFTRSNTQLSHAGDYALVATNLHGSVTSLSRRLTVDGTRTAPSFPVRLGNQTVDLGGTAIFSCPATSQPAATYQWRFNGTNLPGETGPTLRLENVQAAQAGTYSVTASIPGVSASGPSAVLTVRNPVIGYYEGFVRGLTAGDVLGGTFVVVTKADRTAVLLMNINHRPGQKILVASSLAIGADGKFSGTALETLRGRPSLTAHAITGTIAGGGRVTGIGDSLGIAFDGNSLGANAGTHGGYYHAQVIAAANADIHLVIAPGGRVFAFVESPLGADSGADYVTAAGNRMEVLLMLSEGRALTAVIAADTGSLSGKIAFPLPADLPRDPGVTFSGLRDDIPSLTHLANLATRGRVGAGADALIAGFVLAGTASRDVLVRAVGPTLADFGVSGALSDPTLNVGGANLPGAYSENWGSDVNAGNLALTATRVGAFPLPLTSRDAAASALLLPGAYSAEIQIAHGAPGVALVEVYDSSIQAYTPTSPRLSNLSTRGRVGAGADTLIAGFVLSGNAPKRLLIRGIGPALTAFGITDALADPILTISGAAGELIANDDWSASAFSLAEVASAATAVGAFALSAGSRDAAVVVTLPPGAYSAQILGKGDAAGVALVEIYELP